MITKPKLSKVNPVFIVHILFTDFDGKGIDWHFYVNQHMASSFIKMGKKGWVINPPKPYRIRVDATKHGAGQKHVHIYKNDEFLVINQDGTRRHSDGSGIKIPNKLYDWLEKNFPDFDLPHDRVIHYGYMDIPVCDLIIIIDVNDQSLWVIDKNGNNLS